MFIILNNKFLLRNYANADSKNAKGFFMKKEVLTFSVVMLLSACGGQTSQQQSQKASEPSAHAASSVATSRQAPEGARVYRVVTERNYPPFTMHDGKGHSLGFEVELLEAIGARENLYFSFTPQVWEGVLPELKSGKADIAAAGLTVLEERKQDMSFTNPHFISETAMLVPNKSLDKIKSFADLKNQRVSLKKDSLQHQLLIQARHKHELFVFDETLWLNVVHLLRNESDVVVGDWGALAYHNNKYKDNQLTVVRDEKAFEKEELAFAVKKDETALLAALNSGLDKMKQDGSYQKLYNKWFGESAPVTASAVQP